MIDAFDQHAVCFLHTWMEASLRHRVPVVSKNSEVRFVGKVLARTADGHLREVHFGYKAHHCVNLTRR